MQLELAELLSEYIDECEVYYDYSGRGMFGETTTGLVVESLPVLLSGVLENIEHIYRDMDERGLLGLQMESVRKDNLGMETIIY